MEVDAADLRGDGGAVCNRRRVLARRWRRRRHRRLSRQRSGAVVASRAVQQRVHGELSAQAGGAEDDELRDAERHCAAHEGAE